MSEAAHFVVDGSHPSLPGHFPGAPIVPGVVVLDEVRVLALARYGPFALRAVPQVKFTTPLLPGQRAEVAFERSGELVKFTVTHAGAVIARGDLRIAETPSAAADAPPPGPERGP